MSDTGNAEQEKEAGEGNLIPFAKRNPFDANGYAALMLRMDRALERSRATLAEYQAILEIIKRDFTAREGGGEGIDHGDRSMEDEKAKAQRLPGENATEHGS